MKIFPLLRAALIGGLVTGMMRKRRVFRQSTAGSLRLM
jgi:hypothetical protein